ncbi:hypothetical protein Ddc_04118 [Ditylenchus destructor]|nr:hypothetical protein Ddc_04118 [Ditylenchus destructor]
MDSRSQRPVLLNPHDTFEIYEKRSVSPHSLHQSPPIRPSAYITTPSRDEPVMVSDEDNFGSRSGYARFSFAQKKKLPIAWIVGIAVAVPVFVILILFIAVWLQELGII